jgi:hypothetical protein
MITKEKRKRKRKEKTVGRGRKGGAVCLEKGGRISSESECRPPIAMNKMIHRCLLASDLLEAGSLLLVFICLSFFQEQQYCTALHSNCTRS